MAGPHSEDTLMITRTLNAAALRGIMDDARWEHVVAVVVKLLESARARENAARRTPTFDGLLTATQFNGRVLALEDLLRVLEGLYTSAGKVLDEARTKLPYAPTPKGHRKVKEAPARDAGTPSEVKNVARRKEVRGKTRRRKANRG